MRERSIRAAAVLVCLAIFSPNAWAAGIVGNGFDYIYLPAGKGLNSLAFYSHGTRNGISWEYYGNGDVKKEHTYSQNVPNGCSRGYYANGILAYEVFYKNGRRNGPARYYDSAGVMRTDAYYRQGVPDGWAKFYNNDGSLRQAQYYYRGRLESLRQYTANGLRVVVKHFR